MFELTTDNTADYLRSRNWIGTGPVQVESLSGGVSGVVLRVTTPDRRFVLKQPCPQLRTKAAWFSDLDRIWREMEVMQALGPLLPPMTVPEVLFHDRDNYVFAMSHAPEPFRVWKEELLTGTARPETAPLVGQLLGRMHQATADNQRLRDQFADVRIFDQLRIDPFYRTVQRNCPDVAKRIDPIIDRMVSVKDAICHGDYTPKNILTYSQGFTLVDYETAYYGDASMDVGLLLAHLILKTFRDAGGTVFAVHHVLPEYFAQVRYRPMTELESWSIEHCAVCLLARIDGTSLVDYLPEAAKRDAVRQLGRRLLFDPVWQWNQVIEMLFQAIEQLEKSQPEP